MLLQIRNLWHRYDARGEWVLRDVSLDMEAPEKLAVLGPSGAGKSTFIRCLNGLVTPSRGSVKLSGTEVTRLTGARLRAHRRRLGMIFQDFNLINRLSVATNVMTGRFGRVNLPTAILNRFGPADRALAAQALARVGLTGRENDRVSRLSGGQRQRVGVARALVQQPDMILGDEPVSSLDPVTAVSILALLDEIYRRDGMAIILNLHSVDLAREFADRIIGLHDGEIVFDGLPEDIDQGVIDAIYGTADTTGDTWKFERERETAASGSGGYGRP